MNAFIMLKNHSISSYNETFNNTVVRNNNYLVTYCFSYIKTKTSLALKNFLAAFATIPGSTSTEGDVYTAQSAADGQVAGEGEPVPMSWL
jgi:hypothetical protein